RSRGGPAPRLAHARPGERAVARLPHQSHGLPDLGGPARLHRAHRLSHGRDRPRPARRQLLDGRARGLGRLRADGRGAAPRARHSGPERALVVHATLWYTVLLAFGFVGHLAGGIVALFLAGIVQSVAMISLAAWLLIVVDDRFRGRVMGVRMLAVYGLPLGLMAAGALIDLIGYTPTI